MKKKAKWVRCLGTGDARLLVGGVELKPDTALADGMTLHIHWNNLPPLKSPAKKRKEKR